MKYLIQLKIHTQRGFEVCIVKDTFRFLNIHQVSVACLPKKRDRAASPVSVNKAVSLNTAVFDAQ